MAWSARRRSDLRHGLRATEPLIGCRVVVAAAWNSRRLGKRMTAYLGVTVAGFPNFFILLGPNTGLGHNSVVLMIEAQARYAMNCLKLMKRRKQRVIEVRADPKAICRRDLSPHGRHRLAIRRLPQLVSGSKHRRNHHPVARVRDLLLAPHSLGLSLRLRSKFSGSKRLGIYR